MGFIILGFNLLNPIPVHASTHKTPNVYDLISAVNALRASQGLTPLTTNGALMAAAQAQSDYQASIGTWSHQGAGGSRPVDRAAAAGYGGGAKIFISENVAQLSSDVPLDTLIHSIWADSIHWNTMTGAQFTDCGAGISEVDGDVYYTLVVGYISGRAGNSGTIYPTATLGTAVTPKPGLKTATPDNVAAVQVATSRADGAIIHEVQPGQALSSIAVAYQVQMADIRALNNMTANDNNIWAGQKLTIRLAFTPTVSPTLTETPLPPTRTLAPTDTQGPPRDTSTPVPTHTITSRPLLPDLPSAENNPRQSIGIILVVVCSLGLLAVLISNFLKKK